MEIGIRTVGLKVFHDSSKVTFFCRDVSALGSGDDAEGKEQGM